LPYKEPLTKISTSDCRRIEGEAKDRPRGQKFKCLSEKTLNITSQKLFKLCDINTLSAIVMRKYLSHLLHCIIILWMLEKAIKQQDFLKGN